MAKAMMLLAGLAIVSACGDTAPTRPEALVASESSSVQVTPSEQVAKLINAERNAAGLPSLTWSDRLATAAATHAADLVARGYFSHVAPDGNTPADRVRVTGYSACLVAENIAQGQADAAAVTQGWMNSPGHRANNLRRDATEIGAARSDGPTWVAVFARPC